MTITQVKDYQIQMRHRPTKEQLRKAFMDIATAHHELEEIKVKIVELYSAADEVENSTFLVDNYDRLHAPDDDRRDVLFARLENAKASYATMMDNGTLDAINTRLREAGATIARASLV